MKKLALALLIISAASSQAQETGSTAVATAQTAQSNNWQNWTFGAVSIATAAGAIFVVSLHDGSASSSH